MNADENLNNLFKSNSPEYEAKANSNIPSEEKESHKFEAQFSMFVEKSIDFSTVCENKR